MSKLSIEFGYYPRPLNIDAGAIKVETLDDLEITVSDMENSEGIEKEWIYAPLQCRRNVGHEGVEVLPYSSRVFGLPKTHVIAHASADNAEHLDFLIWGLGFFTGMRLTSTEAGLVDATPTKPNKLNDFILIQSDLADTLALTEAFWQRYKADPRMAKRVKLQWKMWPLPFFLNSFGQWLRATEPSCINFTNGHSQRSRLGTVRKTGEASIFSG